MIALYSPDVPDVKGGVADHVLAAAQALASLGAPPLVLAAHGTPAKFAPLSCITGIGPLEAPAAAAAHGARHLILQYVPFLYGRRGVAPGLLRFAARCRDARVTWDLFVHEPYVPFTRLAWLITGWPQRLQLAAVGRGATRIYTPVPGFVPMIRRFVGESPQMIVAPVGASLPVADPAARPAARAGLGLSDDQVAVGVFSPGASGFAVRWLAAAARRLATEPSVAWVLFGSGSARRLPGLPAGGNVIVVGEQDSAAIGRTMRAIDIAALPYVDGLTLRRTSAMLALASSVPTVSSTGPLFDPAVGALARCEPDAEAFASRLLELVRDPAARERARVLTAGYAASASVEVLARRFLADHGTAA